MKKEIKSPIAYMGNKYRLLKTLRTFIPSNIGVFYDVFGGSGTMALNFGKVAVYNEIIPFTKGIVELSVSKPMELMRQCEIWFDAYNLNNDRKTPEKIEQFKKDFNIFRDYVNSLEQGTEIHTMGVYALHIKAINNLIRFNKDGKYNASAGFNPGQGGSLQKLEDMKEFNKSISFNSVDFGEIIRYALNRNDEDSFLYFDPPYLNTTAVYNEKKGFGGWDINEDIRLFKSINTLKGSNIKWAYSNTLVGKDGTENSHIKEWAIENGYYINYLDKSYVSFGHKNAKNVEVLITNYEIEERIKNEQL